MQEALALLPTTMHPVPKIKLSLIIDQSMDTEIPMLGEIKLRELRAAYEVKFGDTPMESADVTDSQLTALYYLIEVGLPPYVDFSVWGGPSGPDSSAE